MLAGFLLAALYFVFDIFSQKDYEYTLENDQLSIDVIYGKKYRKTAHVLELKELEAVSYTHLFASGTDDHLVTLPCRSEIPFQIGHVKRCQLTGIFPCQDMFREFIFITGDKIRILFFEGRIVPGFCIGILHIEFFSEGFLGIV